MHKEPQGLLSNIWKFTVFLILNKRSYASILSVYYLTIPDVTIQSVGLILLCGSLAGFFLEIPSGYISDRIGHKNALILSRVLMLLSSLCFLIGGHLGFLVAGSILISAAFAFVSGTGAAFMHETLKSLGRDKEYTQIMGRVSSLGFAVPILLVVAIPFMVQISFKLPFLIAFILDIIALGVALSFVSPVVVENVTPKLNFKNLLKNDPNVVSFFRYGLFLSVLSGLVLGLSGYRAPYQALLGIPLIYFGLLHGAGRLLASVLLFFNGRLARYFSLARFCWFKAIGYAFFLLLLAFGENIYFVAIVFMLLNAFLFGFTQISRGLLLDLIRNSKYKATLLSVKGQVSQFVSAGVAFVLGMHIHRFGYAESFKLVLIFILCVSMVWYLFLKRCERCSLK